MRNTKREEFPWRAFFDSITFLTILIGFLVFAFWGCYTLMTQIKCEPMTYEVITENNTTVVKVYKTDDVRQVMTFYVVGNKVCTKTDDGYKVYEQDGKTYKYSSLLELLNKKGYKRIYGTKEEVQYD